MTIAHDSHETSADVTPAVEPQIIREARVYLVGRQNMDGEAVQRFLDDFGLSWETDTEVGDERLHAIWLRSVHASHQAYVELVDGLMQKMTHVENKTERRKRVREAARSVLPNATETLIFVSANARALRHFIELRGSEGAEVETRRVALEFLRLMQAEAPTLFGDYEIVRLEDGTEVARTQWQKV